MDVRIQRVIGLWLAIFLYAAILPAPLQAQQDMPRFYYNGDGRIHLASAKSGRTFSGTYRKVDGKYDAAALRAIQGTFDAPADDPMAAISLRLIEFIDFLQDHFNPEARIEISSGWRSPEYNDRLRAAGKLAATASLHQYGMAADIKIAGVPSRQVWTYVRQLGFGGTGYYQGALVHVDVGPARFWDETSSGVGTDISTDNKLINLVTDFDIYHPDDPIRLRFTRMTGFPIGVSPEFVLESINGDGPAERIAVFRPAFAENKTDHCAQLSDIRQMANIRWTLPGDLPQGRYAVRAVFCNKSWDAMPAEIATPVFEVRKP